MVSNRHVFGGSMKRFKRVPFVRKEYIGKPVTSEAKYVIPELNEAAENISVSIPDVEPETEAPVKKSRSRKNKVVENSGDNNEVKNENHE